VSHPQGSAPSKDGEFHFGCGKHSGVKLVWVEDGVEIWTRGMTPRFATRWSILEKNSLWRRRIIISLSGWAFLKVWSALNCAFLKVWSVLNELLHHLTQGMNHQSMFSHLGRKVIEFFFMRIKSALYSSANFGFWLHHGVQQCKRGVELWRLLEVLKLSS